MNGSQEGNGTPDTEQPVKYGVKESIEYLRQYIADVFNLSKGVDKNGAIREIRDKKSMAGANAWMLFCSIVIASIGLSMNSQAVIIGAMLISPLMAPILGIGLAIAINDMESLRRALAYFLIAMVIALLTSTLYFKSVGFIDVTPEILARTRPTFLDVFVAFFGGLAGIISVARKDISTTLPGVAIATALMPPLCVTGFGLAHGQWDVALRSFYLFFLNTFFIAFSTYLIVRLLDFPFKSYLKRSERMRNSIFLTLFSLLLIIPSLLIFRGVIEDYQRDRALRQFQATCIPDADVYLDDRKYVKRTDAPDLLLLKVYGNTINESQSEEYKACLASKGLTNVDILIIPSSSVNLDHIESLQQNIKSLNEHVQLIEQENKQHAQRYMEREKPLVDSVLIKELTKELDILYPRIAEVGISGVRYARDTVSITVPTLVYKTTSIRTRIDEKQLSAYVQERLDIDTLVILRR